MSMQKNIQQLKLEMSAHYQEKTDLNVRFWNQDYNTAVLQFLITRAGFPLSISAENVEVIITLENGNSYVSSNDLDISTEIDGVVSYTIPTEFMSVVSGECLGQIYVGTKDSDEVVVSRQFTFEVSQDLLSSIPSELKLQYIKTFSDLRSEVQDRITSLENEFVIMEDYVGQVQQATTDGLNQLNNLVNSKMVEYNDNHADKLAIIDTTVGNYVQDFLDQRTYIDTQYNDFKNQLLQSDVVVESDTANWQKYKITNDDGTSVDLSNADLNNDVYLNTLSPGNYYAPGPVSSPNGASGFVNVIQRGSIVKIAYFYPYNEDSIFMNRYYDGWSGWEQVTVPFGAVNAESVTGSQTKANTAENNAKAYVDSEMADVHTTIFSGSVQNVGSIVNLSESLYNFEMVVISGNAGGNDFSQVFIPDIIGSVFNIQQFNLRDSDGLLLGMYECRLEMTSDTQIKITTDISYDNPTSSGSGPNRNAYTISRVDGFVRKT